MKFLDKWMDLEDIILSEVTQLQKNTHDMKCILAQKLRLPKIQFADHMKLKKKEDQSVDTWVLLRKGEQNIHGRSYRDKVLADRSLI